MAVKLSHTIELYCGNCGKPFPAVSIEHVEGNDKVIIVHPCYCLKPKE